jgi:hypothetical protein
MDPTLTDKNNSEKQGVEKSLSQVRPVTAPA